VKTIKILSVVILFLSSGARAGFDEPSLGLKPYLTVGGGLPLLLNDTGFYFRTSAGFLEYSSSDEGGFKFAQIGFFYNSRFDFLFSPAAATFDRYSLSLDWSRSFVGFGLNINF